MLANRLKRIVIGILLLVIVWCVLTILQHDDYTVCAYEQDFEPVAVAEETAEEVAGRRIRKVWFAPGAPQTMTQAQYRAEVIAGLKTISEVTATDFQESASSAGAYIKFYVFTKADFWKKWPSLAREKIVPLGRSAGNSIYFTDNPRIVGWVRACTIHETGHRVGIGHSPDPASIMFWTLPVKTMSQADKVKFQQKLGKPQ